MYRVWINYHVHYHSRYHYHYPYSYVSPNRISHQARKLPSYYYPGFSPARSWSSPAVRSQNCCATCHFGYIGWIFEAGGRRPPPQKCGVYRHLPSVQLAKMAMHWASVDLDPMAKMAKNHPANASSREIIKAHMAQWSCHVARTSYHLCFEGSKNPLPKHRMRAGWEFVVSLS